VGEARLRPRDPERPSAGQPEETAEVQERTRSERAIVCAACSASITSATHRITSHGSHEHRFMNPAGLLFHIGCFDQAIGCMIVGPASLEYAWFPGFAWRLALCGQCGVQLGWHFRNDAREGFFGLILDRLREAELDG
jgi:hypothetical protein